MSGGISAIPTRWNGRNYRSRLEARWAIVMTVLGWEHEYEPMDLGGCIPDFVVTNFRHPTIIEAKPAFSAHEFALRRNTLHASATPWILAQLESLRYILDADDPDGVSILPAYDRVIEDMLRVERGEDAVDGPRAIVVGSTMFNDPKLDGCSIDGRHYLTWCGDPDSNAVGLGCLGERCLRCGYMTDDHLMRASTALGIWKSAGDRTQWQPVER